MADIALLFEQGQPFADIQISPPSLEVDKDLQSAVVISLFCNRLAQSGDKIDGDNRHGWWGDSYATVNGSLIGSRLWLLKRSVATQETANLAKQYCLEALQWLVEDQVADSIQVETAIIGQFSLGIGVTINKPNATSANFKFQYVWNQL